MDGNHRGCQWYDTRVVSLWMTIIGGMHVMIIGVSVHGCYDNRGVSSWMGMI